MKKYLSLALTLIMLLSLAPAALADDAGTVRVTLQARVASGVPKAQTLIFDLKDGGTEEILGSKTVELGNEREPLIELEFNVPSFRAGKSFIFHMSRGEAEIEYNGVRGAYFVLSADGSDEAEYEMTLFPASERFVNLSLGGIARADVPLYPYAEGILIPASALSALGISAGRADDGAIYLTAGDRGLVLYPGQLCAYANGEAFNLALAPAVIDGADYVPVADTAAVFGCQISYSDDNRTLNLSLGRTPYSLTPEEERINASGVGSDTEYLIWISKSEYMVRVFRGSAGNWFMIRSFPCAIGAPGTPTVEGVFKYYQKQDRWTYNSYWCGPIMRFREGGYAMHSTLRRYDGSDYDGRVGMKISHGCVRIRPENIEWLAATMPLYTTVYITH